MKIIFYYVDCCSGFLLIQTKFKAFLINTFITQSSAVHWFLKLKRIDLHDFIPDVLMMF